MSKPNFLRELRRRHVWRVAIAYAVVAWLLLQLAAIVLPTFAAPHWVLKVLISVFVLFFPIALIVAWAFEVTPEGVRRTEAADSEEARPAKAGHRVGHTLNIVTIVVLVAAVGVLAWQLNAKSHPGAALAAAPVTSVAAPAAASAIPAKSIAVLPFTNESGDTDQQYFSDGLSEDLITALSQFAGLKVIGRDSAFQFRNTRDDAQTIGEKLGVAHLLEGSVSRQGNEVRISAELINTRDARTLWSQHYDRPYKDLFALQDTITQAVAGALQSKLMNSGGAVVQSDRPPSGSLAAYTAFLQGKFYYARGTEADLRRAITQYQAAIKDDPHYALAYADLSYAWTRLAGQWLNGPAAQQAYAEARAAANTALVVNPNLAAAHGARGWLLLTADFDWAGAEAEFQRAAQLAPHDGASLFNLGNLQATLGHPGQAVKLIRKALATDPRDAGWYYLQSTYLSGLDRLDEAAAAIHKAIELQPAAAVNHEQLAIIEIQRGDAQAALAAAQAEPPGVWQDIALALARQIGPDRTAADAALKHLIATYADGAPYQIAEVYALRRDPNNMFKWLDRAWVSRDPGIQYLLYDPFILRYQHDPRFAAFCKKVGLPTTTTAKAMP
ncbi:MAG: tetratricopeptide repeat protein [Gammaproteobacteria bacterium]